MRMRPRSSQYESRIPSTTFLPAFSNRIENNDDCGLVSALTVIAAAEALKNAGCKSKLNLQGGQMECRILL